MVECKHLRVDPARRIGDRQPKLAQYVRATDEQGYTETVAVEELDRESLLVWVHSRSNRAFVEDCIGHLLGHGALHFKSPLGAYPGPVPALAVDPEMLKHVDRWIEYWRNNIDAYDGKISPEGFADWLQAQRDVLAETK